jgi:hypothetical protein
MPAVLRRRAAAVVLCALAGAGLACGGDDKADRLKPTRTALERALLDDARRLAGLEGTTSVSCSPHGDGFARWDCTLEGGERRTAAVSVDPRGRWTASLGYAPPSTGPRITADGMFAGDPNGGAGFIGCCLPLPK